MTAEETLNALKEYLQREIDDAGGFEETPHIYVEASEILEILERFYS
jgi:hypothetical protein